MTTQSTNPSAAAKSEAEQIVASGKEIRPRLTEVVAQAAETAQKSGQGLVALAQAVLEGAQEGLEKSVPADPNDVLRQVVDALGDGLSQAALAARLAVEEARSAGREFAQEDMTRLRDDMQAINCMFAETVSRTLKSFGSMTGNELSNLASHAWCVKERLSPVVGSVLDAIRRDPILLGKEGLQASVSVARCSAGTLFHALGSMLERASQQLRQQEKNN